MNRLPAWKLTSISKDAEAPVYKKVESGHYNIGNGLEMLTASDGVAKMLRVGDELKATSTADDFSLYVTLLM
mgnify:CR=1 FL=1